MYDWNTKFHGIGIVCEDKCVRVRNDQTLVDFLNDPKTKGSLLIAEYARDLYEEQFGKPLGITQDSLAIEILGHVFVDKLAAAHEQLKIRVADSFLDMIRLRMEVIDCGEADIDNNRRVWDALSVSGIRDIVFAVSGKRA